MGIAYGGPFSKITESGSDVGEKGSTRGEELQYKVSYPSYYLTVISSD